MFFFPTHCKAFKICDYLTVNLERGRSGQRQKRNKWGRGWKRFEEEWMGVVDERAKERQTDKTERRGRLL